jgi:Domain of unknown function (DUF5668)
MTAQAASGSVIPVRLVLGLVVFILGLVFLADSAGMLRADSAMRVWPIGVVALGLIVVLQPDIANRVVGTVLLLAGVWLLLNNVGVWSYGFWRTWPYLLIVFGAWMIYRVRGMRAREAATGDAYVTGFAFLDGVEHHGTIARLQGGDMSAVLGMCDVDLSRVSAASGTDRAVIDVFALFGRISLDVPAGWNVENRVLPLLGRVDVPPPAATAGPTVVVQGSVIGGRISVAAGR